VKDHKSLTLQFLGVRGSIPTPLESCLQAGGNTPCLLIRYANEAPLLIDAGTGLRTYGQQCKPTAANPFSATFLFSHFHWDHIQGFPFFPPIYSPHSRLRLISGIPATALKQHLGEQMKSPHFPVAFDDIAAQCSFEQLSEQGLAVGSLRVTPIALHHPGGATGFRIDSAAGSIAYVSDHEHGNPQIDEQIVQRSKSADLMVYDAHFTPEEYQHHRGWGHSTWLDGVQLAMAAGVRRFALFHHSPSRTDSDLVEIVHKCRELFNESFAANEHDIVTVQKTRS
jgi:phosphoribosyl 1,2-cyclic phosphodiesterase